MFEASIAVLREHEHTVQKFFGDSDPLMQIVRQQLSDLQRLQEIGKSLIERNGDSLFGIELASIDCQRKRTLYCALLPQPDGSGGARLVYFDAEHMYSHVGFNRPEEALETALRSGFLEWAAGAMDRFVDSPAWRVSVGHGELSSAPAIGAASAAASQHQGAATS